MSPETVFVTFVHFQEELQNICNVIRPRADQVTLDVIHLNTEQTSPVYHKKNAYKGWIQEPFKKTEDINIKKDNKCL